MEQYRPTTKLSFQTDKKYHVFLSFRGPDVRKTLVDHLYQALSAAGLKVFLDSDSDKLGRGEIIWKSLEEAIESSAIRIPIFSKGFADSTWCLKEAAKIWSTPGLIIPLFYDVKPTDVRYPENGSGPFQKSFDNHYCRSDCPDRPQRKEIDEWKNALEHICNLSGWTTDITGGYEAQLVKTVVSDLAKTFDRILLEVAEHPVGMDSKKNALIQKLNLTLVDEVIKVGIWGPPGIGKTAIAQAVYNQVYADFEVTCFIFDVRTSGAKNKGLIKLQKQILKNLTKNKEEVQSVHHGKYLLNQELHSRGNRVLLILDDVDTTTQLNALVGEWLAPGSRVIITSRNKHILKVARVSSECIQEVTGLDINAGLQLFSWHAFRRASPSPGFEYLSKRIVQACEGYPYSLEVMGSSLCDKKDTSYWTEAHDNIRHNKDIYKILYSNYSALSDEEKEIFVDIACFFNREHKALPIVFWKSLYGMVDTAVFNLLMKSLIKIDHKDVFDMDNCFRDMGQTIARKEKEGTRKWEASYLFTASNNIKISRLRLNGCNPQKLERFCIPGLYYLHLHNLPIIDLKEDTLAMLPRDLIWLRLEDCPFTTGMNDAARQSGDSTSVDRIWKLKIAQLKRCSGLNSISLSSLFSLPNVQLQHLDLEECESLNNLPYTTGHLPQLEHLGLRKCKNLTSLTDTIGKLSLLQHLDLGCCERLNNLPEAIGDLSEMQYLNLECCVSLESLPDTIGKLSFLKHLNLSCCYELNNLPDTIGDLLELQHLNLRRCDRLRNLPNTIGKLSQLQQLNLEECINLNELPETIGDLKQLHLKLRGCNKLNSLLIPLAIYRSCSISFN